jgi:hypothetical protein
LSGRWEAVPASTSGCRMQSTAAHASPRLSVSGFRSPQLRGKRSASVSPVLGSAGAGGRDAAEPSTQGAACWAAEGGCLGRLSPALMRSRASDTSCGTAAADGQLPGAGTAGLLHMLMKILRPAASVVLTTKLRGGVERRGRVGKGGGGGGVIDAHARVPRQHAAHPGSGSTSSTS